MCFIFKHVHLLFEQVHIVSGVFVAKKYAKPTAAPAPAPAAPAAEPAAKAAAPTTKPAAPAPNGQAVASVPAPEGGEYR